MRYFHLTKSVMADGLIYGVVRSRQSRDDGRSPPIPNRSHDVIARHDRKWLMGTFRPDGSLFGSVMRDYDSSDIPCCMEASWDPKYRCGHKKTEGP